MSTQDTTYTSNGPPQPAALQQQQPLAEMAQRLQEAERQGRWLKYTLLVMAPLLIYVFIGQELPEQLIQRDPLVSSDRFQLFDEKGNTRMYMRVYSGVPLVQLIDENGKPRLSLGLRYDDSPFISLSDAKGQTRASLQVGENELSSLNIFDENGEATFSVQ